MADIAGPYSSLKILHHPERIAALKRGEQIVPTHVEMILSDLCNHDCSWCLVGETLIDTPFGQVRIDSLKKGDCVITPLGGIGKVRANGARDVSEIMEVVVDGRTLRITGEHPILTQDGYKRADELRIGDSAAVRMWVRPDNNLELQAQPMERAPSWTPRQAKDGQALSALSDDEAVSRSARMPLRLRWEGEGVSKNAMERLHSRPRDEWGVQTQQGNCRNGVSADGREQPNEAAGSCGTSGVRDEGHPATKDGSGEKEHCRCGTEADAFGQESDEGCRDASQGNGEGVFASGSVEERDAFSAVVRTERACATVDRQCRSVDWEEESRLSGSESEESYRGCSEGNLHEPEKHPNAGKLRHAGGEEVSAEEVELLGSIQARSPWDDPARTCASDEVLHGDNRELERCLALRPIASVRRLFGQFRVYNLSIEPFEAFIANGVVTHNCAYRWEGYTSNELFAKDVPLAQFGTNNPIRMLPKEKALEIIDDMVEMGVGALEATGGGEPTVHPDCVEIMKYALDKGLDVALVSNGELFRPGHIENLLRCKWVRFSLDAATPEVYAANRRIAAERMNRVTNNIKSLAEARRKYVADGNKCDLIIGIGFVLNKDNWWEVAECAKLAKSLGADNIRISAVFQPDDEHYFKDFYEEAAALCKEARKLDDGKFRVFDNFGERYQDLVDKNPEHPFCGYQQFTTYIGADQSAFRCCLLAYSERGKIGSLKEQRFKDLWNSEEKKEDFAKFDATKCQRCMFSSKLRTILYALDPAPMHANFV